MFLSYIMRKIYIRFSMSSRIEDSLSQEGEASPNEKLGARRSRSHHCAVMEQGCPPVLPNLALWSEMTELLVSEGTAKGK